MTKGLKVIIAGGRDFENYEAVKEAVIKSGFKIVEIVSGGAKGADALGERYAKEHNIPCKVFKAKWNDIDNPLAQIAYRKDWYGKEQAYVKNAGFLRNEDMARYVNEAKGGCILMPGGNGTANMLKFAKEYKLLLYIYEEPKDISF